MSAATAGAARAGGHEPLAQAAALAAAWALPVALLVALGGVVAARWALTTAGFDALWVGLAFGAALAFVAALGRGARAFRSAPAKARCRLAIGRRGTRGFVAPVAIGAAFGLALVAVVVAGAAIAGSMLVPGLARPAAPFLPWALITILVASAEELLLRGRIFDGIRRAGGLPAAVVVTTLAFALMHVPLYGWHVVPLDLAVGFGLAGLRIATRSVVAPAAAHSVADLTTWWL